MGTPVHCGAGIFSRTLILVSPNHIIEWMTDSKKNCSFGIQEAGARNGLFPWADICRKQPAFACRMRCGG